MRWRAREGREAGGDPAELRDSAERERRDGGAGGVHAAAVDGGWKHRGGGLQLSTSGSFPFNAKRAADAGADAGEPLGRAARVVNMSRLGQALTTLGRLRRTASGEGAVCLQLESGGGGSEPERRCCAGLRREDLFTVVHEQFFTDTADYADVLLPAPTFLEAKDVQGAYGHLFAQVSEQAIAPLGEARNNVAVFGELGRRMGFAEACFRRSRG